MKKVLICDSSECREYVRLAKLGRGKAEKILGKERAELLRLTSLFTVKGKPSS